MMRIPHRIPHQRPGSEAADPVMIYQALTSYAPPEAVLTRAPLEEVYRVEVSTTTPAETAQKRCSGPCGRTLPLSSFGVNSGRRDGRRSECRQCQKARRGPRGRDAQRARSLERELLALLGTFGTPPLADVLTRALDEVHQVGAPGASFDEQVEAVRRAVFVQGCRRVDEIVEEAGLSRAVVDRALERLLAAGAVEGRGRFRLADEAQEAGRPVVEYHPKGYPSGDDFTRLYRRRAVEDDLL